MSNYSICILILIKLIGFEETIVDNNKKIVLPDEFDVDIMTTFKEYFENFQSKKTYQMCGIPVRNVCVHYSLTFASSNQKKTKKESISNQGRIILQQDSANYRNFQKFL